MFYSYIPDDKTLEVRLPIEEFMAFALRRGFGEEQVNLLKEIRCL